MKPTQVSPSNQYYIRYKLSIVGNNALFWRSNANGYTCDLADAGIYSLEDASFLTEEHYDEILPVEIVVGLSSRQVNIFKLNEGKTKPLPSEVIEIPYNLNPNTAKLVVDFAEALALKLAAAEKKYGYQDGWKNPDWKDKCIEEMMKHLEKGDPRDVAIYCAFMWYHKWSTNV